MDGHGDDMTAISREPSCDRLEITLDGACVKSPKLDDHRSNDIHVHSNVHVDHDINEIPHDKMNGICDDDNKTEPNSREEESNGDHCDTQSNGIDEGLNNILDNYTVGFDGDTEQKEENDECVDDDVPEKCDNISNDDKSKDVETKTIDILGNGLLWKTVTKSGDGHRPEHGEVVTIQLSGELADSIKVDVYDELTFTLGDGDVITALELCLPLMELNEECTLKTDPKYAYGRHGNGKTIGSNASITYSVNLNKIDPAPNYVDMSIEEIIQISESKRGRGNYYFERTDFSSAITSYTKALHIADSHSTVTTDTTEQLQSLLDIRVKCYNNLAASQLKIEAYTAAVKSCDFVLRYSSQNVKALFRKAKACSSLGRLKESCVLLKKALQLEPESKLIHVELSRVTNKLKNESQSAKKMYQKMFGLDGTKSKPKSKWTSWTITIAGAVIVTAVSVGIALYRNQH